MGSTFEEEEFFDINESEINEYKEVTYKLLKFRTHKVRGPDGKFRCPFCADKERAYHYTLLLQHAIRVSEGSADSAKQRANHYAMATYLVTDLADEAEPPAPPPDADCGDDFKNAMGSVQECYRKLVEKLKEKEEEYSCLISKERQSNSELQGARKALIKGFEGLKDMPSQSRVVIGVKKMGELDHKAFIKACQSKYPAWQGHIKAAELCSLWQQKLKNPKWHPFRVKDVKGTTQRLLDEDDKALRGLQEEWGREVYEAVTTSLVELQEYNPSGCYPVSELWNFKGNAKASLEEAINYAFTQLKMLKRKRS